MLYITQLLIGVLCILSVFIAAVYACCTRYKHTLWIHFSMELPISIWREWGGSLTLCVMEYLLSPALLWASFNSCQQCCSRVENMNRKIFHTVSLGELPDMIICTLYLYMYMWNMCSVHTHYMSWFQEHLVYGYFLKSEAVPSFDAWLIQWTTIPLTETAIHLHPMGLVFKMKVTQCPGRLSANTRLHQLWWGGWELPYYTDDMYMYVPNMCGPFTRKHTPISTPDVITYAIPTHPHLQYYVAHVIEGVL